MVVQSDIQETNSENIDILICVIMTNSDLLCRCDTVRYWQLDMADRAGSVDLNIST